MNQPSHGELASGILEVNPKGGYGFVRKITQFYVEKNNDLFVSPDLIRKFKLKSGLHLEGQQIINHSGKPVLKHITTVNGIHPAEWRKITPIRKLKVVTPCQRLRLETPEGPFSMRVIDLVSPIGKGSRGLIVSPPKTGKTTLIKEIAQAVHTNHPEVEIFALLVDERPEEVTDIRRSIKGQVIASSIDQPISHHVKVTRLTAEMVTRLVELKKDVLVIVDSITRICRAFNHYEGNSGRTLTGGLDSCAMEYPRNFFGQARKIEKGGSLTIIGTALIDTGSKMDEHIFQEFQGTGNLEIFLSRSLAEKRIWPAIDIQRSHTRKEEFILDHEELLAVNRMRKGLSNLSPEKSMDGLSETLKKFENNADFINMLVNAKLG